MDEPNEPRTPSPANEPGVGGAPAVTEDRVMTREQTLHSTIPFSVLATVMLAVAVALLGATFVIEEHIYRYFCLGAFTALLGATVILLAVTKALIWPSTIALRR